LGGLVGQMWNQIKKMGNTIFTLNLTLKYIIYNIILVIVLKIFNLSKNIYTKWIIILLNFSTKKWNIGFSLIF